MTRCARRAITRVASILLVFTCVSTRAFSQSVIEMRGRDGTLSGTVERLGPEGILLKPDDTSGPRTRWISWDRVRSVKGDRAADAAAFADLADRLWRARTRLERGDLPMAEPEIERLATANPPLGGPSGVLLAELVLRAHLVRASQTGAVFAYLRWSAVKHAADGTAAVWVGGASTLSPVVDRTTGLPWQCPPVFTATVSTAALEAFVASPEWDRLGAVDQVTRDLATLYRTAAAGEVAMRSGVSAAVINEIKSKDAGVEFARDVVMSRAGTPEQRAAAREALEKRLAAKPLPARPTDAEANEPAQTPTVWPEAWCRLALGRSLAMETDLAAARRGVLLLLHVPARFANEQPLVAPGALAEAAEALDRLGDKESAKRLRAEYQRVYSSVPLHAALWDRKFKTIAHQTPHTTEVP